MDNASIYEKDLPPLPEEDLESSMATLKGQSGSMSSSSALGLSGGGHGPIYYLTRIQRYSSYTFSFFAGLHFANTSLIPLITQSVPHAEPYLLMTREVYQTPITEPLLVGLPVAAHVISGIALRLVRRSQNLKRYHGGATPGMYALHRANTSSSNSSSNHRIWPALSYVSISGYVFTASMASHVFMNRVLPLVVEGDSSNIGLQYVAHGFAKHGVGPWIAYAVLMGVGCGHMIWGAAKWLGIAPPMGWTKTTYDKKMRKRRRRAWWGINGLALVAASLWAAGGLGVVARGGPSVAWLGSVFDGIYGFVG